jgi:UDP:flavonoid glycosyltransferase YjiC (YdhE family)
MPHLLVDISYHGFGHISQTAPVVNALAQMLPDLRVTVRTAAPAEILQQRFQCEFAHIPAAFDFGMVMANAVEVLAGKSADAYREFHVDWEAKVRREALAMQALKPDLLFANVPYLSLAAARLARIPAVAMCSLNWADIYRHYCEADAASREIHAQMLAAYNSAAMFLQPQPSMPMSDFANIRRISPIATVGLNRRAEIAARLPIPTVEKIVLVAMGGMKFRLPMESWPRIPGVHWLVPAAWGIARDDTSAFESYDLPFSDVFASCDAVLTKPGYGTFSEAACAGVPVLYVTRSDWPEESHLVQWLRQNGVCLEVGRAVLEKGELNLPLTQLWAIPRPSVPVPSGNMEAAQILRDFL